MASDILLQNIGTGTYNKAPSHNLKPVADKRFPNRRSRKTVLNWTELFSIVEICGLLITTALSVLLLVSSSRKWTFSPSAYQLITNNRASVQFVLQLLSNALALVYVTVICGKINRATRLYWSNNVVLLNTVRFWNGLCLRKVHWKLPPQLIALLLAFILVTAAPSAIWSGALTPVATTITGHGTISVPGYGNMSSIKEWPSEIRAQGPTLRSPKGLFGYSVGMLMQGSLLVSASSATPVDGSMRQHPKLDNSRFTFFGRSYGVGAPVGLTDDALVGNLMHTAYAYQETGYQTTVKCIYNSSTQFVLAEQSAEFLFEAIGELPNSATGDPEVSTYLGHSGDTIVAIGVGRNPEDPRRMLGIAAGNYYQHLNTTQCSMTFIPTLFNVSVGLTDHNITVTVAGEAAEFDSDGMLSQVAMRQFELISNDQTNLYVSVVGNSLNSSITDYITANNGSATLSLSDATLPGLQNALAAMLDDILVAYGSAQLLIQNDVISVDAVIFSAALRPGEDVYIYAIFVINAAVLLLAVIEGVRTRAWRSITAVDYLDPGLLMVTSCAGGRDYGCPEAIGKRHRMEDQDLKARLYNWSLDSLESRVELLSDVDNV